VDAKRREGPIGGGGAFSGCSLADLQDTRGGDPEGKKGNQKSIEGVLPRLFRKEEG